MSIKAEKCPHCGAASPSVTKAGVFIRGFGSAVGATIRFVVFFALLAGGIYLWVAATKSSQVTATDATLGNTDTPRTNSTSAHNEQQDYQKMSFADFKLDAKQLAAAKARIALSGFYLKVGRVEYLFPTFLAVAMMRQTFSTDPAIALLTEDAGREARHAFLNCQDNPTTAQISCQLNVRGRAAMCTNGTGDVPCLAVDEIW